MRKSNYPRPGHKCSDPQCPNTQHLFGYCKWHYDNIPAERRFWLYVNKTDDCWLWTGGTRLGYGRFKVNGRSHSAHRLSYEWECGPVPDGQVLDHLCRNTGCVRPSHLQPVTQVTNVWRGDVPCVRFWKDLRCRRGHDLSEPGAIYYKGGTQPLCAACTAIRKQRRNAVLRRARAERRESA